MKYEAEERPWTPEPAPDNLWSLPPECPIVLRSCSLRLRAYTSCACTRLSSAKISANPMLYQRFQEGYLVEINEVREGGMAIRVHSQKAVEVPRGIHKKVLEASL